jgi:hypothetical protein
VKIGRLLVATCAAFALALACVTGELRGTAAVDDGGSDVASATDLFEAVAPVTVAELAPPASGDGVFVDLQFPPSRVTTADVFRPPRARL